LSGSASVTALGSSFPLLEGMYFSLPDEGRIDGEGRGIIISSFHHRGLFSLGGPIEPKGRLRYIDGCTDTLLLAPTTMGDPCLNLLHIPPHTRQTSHTHPSLRLGIVVSGMGHCVTPSETILLGPGTLFYIPADARHSFHTGDEALRVIAYHPDSDFGPTHENHPMVNKTIIS
jgi:quercetin dioxygenase-like cupin family protein